MWCLVVYCDALSWLGLVCVVLCFLLRLFRFVVLLWCVGGCLFYCAFDVCSVVVVCCFVGMIVLFCFV